MHKTAFSPSLHKTCLVQGYCMWLSSPESCWRWSGRRSWQRWAGICPWTGRSSSCPEHRHSCLFQWDPQTGWVWKQRRDQVTQTGHLHLPQTGRNITTNPRSLMVISALECGSQNHGFKSCGSQNHGFKSCHVRCFTLTGSTYHCIIYLKKVSASVALHATILWWTQSQRSSLFPCWRQFQSKPSRSASPHRGTDRRDVGLLQWWSMLLSHCMHPKAEETCLMPVKL